MSRNLRQWSECLVLELVLLALLFTPAPAVAAVTGTTGDVVVLPAPPADVRTGRLEGHDAVVFVETAGVVLADDLPTDDPDGSIGAGTFVASYLIHFDPSGGDSEGQRSASGTIAFDTPILGIIFTTGTLGDTDIAVGNTGTEYDESDVRGATDLGDSINFSGNTITFSFTATGGIDEVRVITVVSPLTMIEELIRDVAALNLANGIENSLDAKLDAATGALDDMNENNDAAARNTLEAFINHVESQASGKISDEDADTLILRALAIISALEAP